LSRNKGMMKNFGLKSLAGTAVAGFLAGYLTHKMFNAQKPTIESGKPAEAKKPSVKPDYNSEDYHNLLKEQLVRNYQFFGEEGQQKIMDSFVIVVGLGGVGSHCATSIARSGAKKMRLIDFDRVTLSSLNRHAVATHADVGLSKVESMKRHFLEFVPHMEIDAVEGLFSQESAEEMLAGRPDFVIDCIDNVKTKIELITFCKRHGLKVISSCGAGAKADPTRLQITDISVTREDELARAVRKGLRKFDIYKGVPVIYSTEESNRKLLPLKDHQEDNPKDYQTLANFRLRIIPVLGSMPALMGQAIAGYVLCDLADQPFEPRLEDPTRFSQYLKCQQLLWDAERKLYQSDPNGLDHDIEEIQLIVKHVFNWKSSLTGDRAADLVRWDPSKPANLDNLALMSSAEAKAHRKLKDLSTYTPEIISFVREQSIQILNIVKKIRP